LYISLATVDGDEMIIWVFMKLLSRNTNCDYICLKWLVSYLNSDSHTWLWHLCRVPLLPFLTLFFFLLIYRIVQNSGMEKLWWISDFKVLAKKTLANAQYLYYGRRENFGESSFVTFPKWFAFIGALTHDRWFERSCDR